MYMDNNIQVEVLPNFKVNRFNYDGIIYDLNSEISSLKNNADQLDYLISVSSGILTGMIDVFFTDDFTKDSIAKKGDAIAENIVRKSAKLFGVESNDLSECVRGLEKCFPLASDGNTPEFGGGLQHHLRDFAHHPNIVGLVFSLLTQFTGKAYGTDPNGRFIIVNVSSSSQKYIGHTIPEKIINGTMKWFFHLVSDMAGSSHTAIKSGGAGLPGPILSLAKELSTLPFFRNIKIGDHTLSTFLSKLYNGTLLASHDDHGRIIPLTKYSFDLRKEMGITSELSQQAIPVVMNDCIVRCFFMIRRLSHEMKQNRIHNLDDFKKISWDNVKPAGHATITRMLTISSAVFSTVDMSAAILTKKYWISVNYVGLGRCALAINDEIVMTLKIRNLERIKDMYQNIQNNVDADGINRIHKDFMKILKDMQFGLSLEQTEILYNLEYYKTLYDFSMKDNTLKKEWLDEWKTYITEGFSEFVHDSSAVIHWYDYSELIERISDFNPKEIWFRQVLLEALIFEPYFPLCEEENKKGELVPSKKYNSLKRSYHEKKCDDFINQMAIHYGLEGYVPRVKKTYHHMISKLTNKMTRVLKITVSTLIGAVIFVSGAGVFAGPIATILVGSQFTGLSGAALVNACLAFIGGGSIAAGGAGMAGGTAVIVGGAGLFGSAAGLGTGALLTAGEAIKENTVVQSAKLLTIIREIFLNDEHNIEDADRLQALYEEELIEYQKFSIELKNKYDHASSKQKKDYKKELNTLDDIIKTMDAGKKDLNKFISSYKEGLNK